LKKLQKKLCLKIDVDTHDGMKNGVPALLKDLKDLGVKATFCLSFGPDNAGKAIFRLFRDLRFLKKMLKTGAPRLYGLRTVLSGTLLPARPIAVAFPALCRQIKADGHEVIVHAWDHRRWQDHVKDMSIAQIEAEFEKAFSAFSNIFGERPKAVAAPGWQVSENSLLVQDRLGLIYASDLRQGVPCFLMTKTHKFKTLQIPTTGPCLEELLAVGIKDERELSKALFEGISKSDNPVLALHAEVEGGIFREFFKTFAKNYFSKFDNILTLNELATTLLKDQSSIPYCNLAEIELPGRAGKVATCIFNSKS